MALPPILTYNWTSFTLIVIRVYSSPTNPHIQLDFLPTHPHTSLQLSHPPSYEFIAFPPTFTYNWTSFLTTLIRVYSFPTNPHKQLDFLHTHPHTYESTSIPLTVIQVNFPPNHPPEYELITLPLTFLVTKLTIKYLLLFRTIH